MRRIESLRPRALIIILNLLAVSLASGESDKTIVPPSSYGGLTFRLVEDRTRIRHPVPADKKVQVDLRSTLFLVFEPLQVSDHTAEPSPKWKPVQDLLDAVKKLTDEYASLNAELVDISDPCAVEMLRKNVRKHDEKTDEALGKAFDMAASVGWPKKEFRDLLLGKTTRPDYKEGQGFVNLALFLEEQISDLQKEARQFRQEKDGYELTVIALHKQAGGGTSRIHVDEYDNLSGGDPDAPRPLERYGIRMTPKELRRFRMEVKASQKAADTIREIMDNRDEIRSGVKHLRSQLKTKLDNMAELFDEDGLWKRALANSLDQLTTLEDDPNTPDNVKTASIELRKTLAAIEEDINAAKDIVIRANELRGYLLKGSTIDLFEVIAGESTMLRTLEELADQVEKLQILEKWKDYLDAITKYAEVVAKHLGTKAATEQIEIYLEDLPRLPETADFMRFIHEYMSSKTEQVVKAADNLEDVADPIYHDIKDPPTATIDLDQYRHLERKDGIIVKVIFRAKETEGLNGIEHIESYYLELEKLDVHTSVSASLIFARASSGTQQAKRWAPNVAAMVNWHYRIREPQGRGDEIWNWLNPGAGVHLASLDQGDDTVEFGIGANLSFWNGLLNAGYGYNLSQPEDREYFFVGLNLLHLLDVARGTASTPSWERGIDFR